MFKKIFSIVILLITFTSTYSLGQLKIGIKAGLNLNTVKSVNFPSNGIRYFQFNSHAGISTQFDINKKLHLNTDVLISTRGYTAQNLKTNLTYLNVPVLVSYSLSRLLEFELGPDFSIKLSENPNEQGLKFKSVDAGLSAGIRFNLTEKFTLTNRYYHGLTSIASYTSDKESKSFNRTIQVSASYRIK
jgi:hypothetical protein